MITSEYTVRVGSPRAERAETYDELLRLGADAEERDDDGAIAGPWLTAPDCGWGWNEGPCPCGGAMRWAEAGYVPWHRICDRCGSHWEMHPVRIFLDRATRTPCIPVERPHPMAGDHPADQPHHVDVCTRCGAAVLDIDAGFCPGGYLCGECEAGVYESVPHPSLQYVGAGDGSKESAMAVRYAQAVRALIRPEDITDEAVRHGAIYGGWARRARFYR